MRKFIATFLIIIIALIILLMLGGILQIRVTIHPQVWQWTDIQESFEVKIAAEDAIDNIANKLKDQLQN